MAGPRQGYGGANIWPTPPSHSRPLVFFSPLAQQQWRRRVSECGGRGADWLPTPEQWILLPFIWFQFRRRVREGEGGGSGLPLYRTVTEFFTTSLTPSFCNDRLLNMKYYEVLNIYFSLNGSWFIKAVVLEPPPPFPHQKIPGFTLAQELSVYNLWAL